MILRDLRNVTQMRHITIICIGLLFSSSLLAQWSGGVTTIVLSNLYLGTDTEIRVLPIITYEGKRLSWRGPSLAYKLSGFGRSEQPFSLSWDLAPNQLDTDDSDRLDGINDRKFLFMFGANYTHPFNFATALVSIETDISNKHKGHRTVVGLKKLLFADAKRKWIVNLSVELEYLSNHYADYDFSIDLQEQANSVYSQYQVGSVMQPGVTLGGYYFH
jgi:outer membrane protein